MNAPGIDRVRNAGLRGRDHALADPQVAGDADLPGQHDVVFDARCCRRCRPAPRSSTRSPTRDAVRDLHQVVDLGAGADARLADRRTIDRRVRADLDVVFDHDGGVLRDLEVRAVGLRDEPEAVAADDRAVLQRRRGCRCTRSRTDTCAWITQSSPIDRAVADHRTGIDDRARADRWRRRRHSRARRSTHRRPSCASARPRSSGRCLAQGPRRGDRSSSACANARYG